MSTEQVADLLVYVGAPGATLFVIAYMVTAKWWRSLVGCAIVVSKIGLAGLVDLSLLFHFLGPTYPYRAQAVLAAFALIVLGTYMYLAALIRVQILKRRRHR